MDFVTNLSTCGFQPSQGTFHEVLQLMADDASNCVAELPLVLKSMAAQGATMTPETCHLCCVLCLNAGHPSAASFVLDLFVREGYRPEPGTIELVRQAGGTIPSGL